MTDLKAAHKQAEQENRLQSLIQASAPFNSRPAMALKNNQRDRVRRAVNQMRTTSRTASRAPS